MFIKLTLQTDNWYPTPAKEWTQFFTLLQKQESGDVNRTLYEQTSWWQWKHSFSELRKQSTLPDSYEYSQRCLQWQVITGQDESLPYGSNFWLCHYARTKALAEQEVLSVSGPGGLYNSLR